MIKIKKEAKNEFGSRSGRAKNRFQKSTKNKTKEINEKHALEKKKKKQSKKEKRQSIMEKL